MSHQTEIGETRTTAEPPPPTRSPTPRLELIGCDGCGRRFATDDGPGMIAMIKGSCPDCGGRFQLVND